MSRSALIGIVAAVAVYYFLGYNSSKSPSRALSTTTPSFLGVPVSHHPSQIPPYSTVHCIGETFQQSQKSHLYRSCQFRNVCFDTALGDFVLFPSPQEQSLAALVKASNQDQQLVTLSSLISTAGPVSLQADATPWFPRVLTERPTGYYQLPDTYVLVPFQESRPISEESLRNTDFLSIFVVLMSFGLENKKMVLLRHGTEECDASCQTLLEQQGRTLMGSAGTMFWRGELSSSSSSSLVCAKYGAAGTGAIMAGKGPVWDQGRWTQTHTVGRDAIVRAFEDFVRGNVQRAM